MEGLVWTDGVNKKRGNAGSPRNKTTIPTGGLLGLDKIGKKALLEVWTEEYRNCVGGYKRFLNRLLSPNDQFSECVHQRVV